MKSTLSALIAVLLLSSLSFAQSTKPALPASGEDGKAAEALKQSTRHGEWADVPVAGSELKIHTWIVYPERPDKAPVVLVIHEIFGMSDWVRGIADQLAANGFIAVAPDFLSGKGPNGGGTESFNGSATSAVGKLSSDEEMKCLDAVREYALSFPAATQKSACIGFCWGGGVSFDYATHQPKLNAAVVYYGTPPKKDEMAKIPCPILGCYGGNDARVTATVEPTKATMAELKKDYSPNIYPGAGHGFLRQWNSNDANLKAAESAWPTTIEFLKKNLD